MKVKVIMFALSMVVISSTGIFAAESQPAESSPQVMDQAKEHSKFCLVCGPEEETETLGVSYKYKGRKYSFCSMDCMKAFKSNPEKYLKSDSSTKEDKDHEDHKGHEHK